MAISQPIAFRAKASKLAARCYTLGVCGAIRWAPRPSQQRTAC